MKLPVDEFTTPAPETVRPEDDLKSVRETMESLGIRHIPVVENNRPVGIISSRDITLIANIGREEQISASQIMHKGPFTVPAGTPLEQTVLEMSTRKIGSAIVVDGTGEIVGIFTSTDALNALVEVLRDDETIKAYRDE